MESDKVAALKWCCHVDWQHSLVTLLQMIGVMEFSICGCTNIDILLKREGRHKKRKYMGLMPPFEDHQYQYECLRFCQRLMEDATMTGDDE